MKVILQVSKHVTLWFTKYNADPRNRTIYFCNLLNKVLHNYFVQQ